MTCLSKKEEIHIINHFRRRKDINTPTKLTEKRERAREKKTEMPFFYNKAFGGRRAGGTITADRHGVHRPVWRFRMCGLNCFR